MFGSLTVTGWKRRSSAVSFSMCLRYSVNVVAPMTWISPRESAGFRMLAAFMLPSASPAPTMLCTSSMTRMTLPMLADLLDEALHAALELATELRTGDERGEVKKIDLLASAA